MPSRLLLATACIDGVLDVITRSYPPAVNCRAIATPVGRSPCALNCSMVTLSPSRKPREARPIEQAPDALVEYRRVRVLENRDALDFVRPGAQGGPALVAIGEQQDRGRGRNQQQPERQTLESIGHVKDEGVSRDLVLPYRPVSTAALSSARRPLLPLAYRAERRYTALGNRGDE